MTMTRPNARAAAPATVRVCRVQAIGAAGSVQTTGASDLGEGGEGEDMFFLAANSLVIQRLFKCTDELKQLVHLNSKGL